MSSSQIKLLEACAKHAPSLFPFVVASSFFFVHIYRHTHTHRQNQRSPLFYAPPPLRAAPSLSLHAGLRPLTAAYKPTVSSQAGQVRASAQPCPCELLFTRGDTRKAEVHAVDIAMTYIELCQHYTAAPASILLMFSVMKPRDMVNEVISRLQNIEGQRHRWTISQIRKVITDNWQSRQHDERQREAANTIENVTTPGAYRANVGTKGTRLPAPREKYRLEALQRQVNNLAAKISDTGSNSGDEGRDLACEHAQHCTYDRFTTFTCVSYCEDYDASGAHRWRRLVGDERQKVWQSVWYSFFRYLRFCMEPVRLQNPTIK